MCLVENLDRAYQAFHRVLKPGGRASVYQTYATDRLDLLSAASAPAGVANLIGWWPR